MADDDSGFLGRWSRRKALAKQGVALPEPAPSTAEPASADMPPSPRQASPLSGGAASLPKAQASVARPATDVPAQARTAAPASDPVDQAPTRQWTMDDVRSLTPESDFSPFVARDVAPEVRNAALKKLFADPQFNVMDGLDIYIDDYSKPNPMPADWARKMVSAQFMNLFKDDPAPGEPQTNSEALAQAAPQPDAGLPPASASGQSPALPVPDGPGTVSLAPPVVPPVAVAEAQAPSLTDPSGPVPAANSPP